MKSVIALPEQHSIRNGARSKSVVHSPSQPGSTSKQNPPLLQSQNISSLTFRNLTVRASANQSSFFSFADNTTVDDSSSEKLLLNDVSGHVQPGLCAVLGESGSGKSTLLLRLAHRLSSEGRVFVDDKIKSSKWFNRHTAFVPQQPILLSTLTARETLRFASLLKVKNYTKIQHEQNVDRLINDLNLIRCADSVIGEAMLGTQSLSGGELQRVSVGVELVNQPRLLFADEVCTGLDSTTALKVLRCLKIMTQQNHTTVLVTIHQPNYEMWKLFDNCIFLYGGSVIYCGPINYIKSYFSSIGYKIPQFTSHAEFMLDLCCTAEMNSDESKAYIDYLIESYKLYWSSHDENIDDAERTKREQRKKKQFLREMRRRLKDKLEFDNKSSHNLPDLPHANNSMHRVHSTPMIVSEHQLLLSRSPNPFFTTLPTPLTGSPTIMQQILILFERSQINNNRQPLLKIAQFLQGVVLSLLCGGAFFQMDLSQQGLQNRLGAILFMTICLLFANCFDVILNFANERLVFLREQTALLYYILPYFLSKTCVDLMPTAICTMCFSLITYPMIGFQMSFNQFIYFVFAMLFVAFCGQSLGLCIACFVPDRVTAMLLCPAILTPFILFTPYSLNTNDDIIYTRPWYILIKYLSPFYWSFTGLMINEFYETEFFCKENEVEKVKELSEFGIDGICLYTRGELVMERFGINNGGILTKSWCLFMLFTLSIFYRFIAFWLLKRFAIQAKSIQSLNQMVKA